MVIPPNLPNFLDNTPAISSLSLYGLVRSEDQSDVAVKLPRHDALPLDLSEAQPTRIEREYYDYPSDYVPEPTPRPPSKRPKIGDNLHVSVSLGQRLGAGRCGIVYALDDVHVSGASALLPPLVAKIAWRHRAMELVREAWVYDELEYIQGVAVARCFGLFTLSLPASQTCTLWDDPRANREPSSPSAPAEYAGEFPLAHLRERHDIHELLLKFSDARNELVVLLLEHLEPADYSETYHENAVAVYKELAHMGVEAAADMGLRHLMRAPTKIPPGLPSLPSPFTGITHALRVVDLDMVVKTCSSVESLTELHNQWIVPFDLPWRSHFNCTS
ncbi:hypothetical protein EXIGLDRAFT_505369 [Exidia glandulosa HHB12029]|uniref:Protein kinase domain-containing protein n=1 Tax=Exidia glandulosa HHB12029 TaxID=1314781 RepID=A0A165JAL3_EXIGL|nr:hypothetical protein EXIGLDRAFT_505369 [Exidia glandulosa HHB12029]